MGGAGVGSGYPSLKPQESINGTNLKVPADAHLYS